MHIRTLRNEEFDLVENIYALSKLDELRYESNCFQLLPIRQDERRLRELLECDIYVFEDGRVLGYGALVQDEIRALYVLPDARGMGVGSRLLEFMLNRVTHPVRLFIAKSNSPARCLYERYGFRIAREFETTYNGVPVLVNEMARASSDG